MAKIKSDVKTLNRFRYVELHHLYISLQQYLYDVLFNHLYNASFKHLKSILYVHIINYPLNMQVIINF